MEAFFAHLQELLSQGYTQVLIGVFIVVQAWWWLKVLLARRNKRFTEPHKASYAVVIAAHRPDPDLLRRTLKSITMYGKPTEIIVAIDDAPNAPKTLKSVAHKYATKVIEAPFRQGLREQYVQAAEGLKKKSDVIIAVAAGTVWDESTVKILAPFADSTVGAVNAHEVILQTETFAQKINQWLSRVYFSVTVPFQGAFGAVRPLSAHMFAVRRDIFTASVIASRSETFLGRRILTNLNESLTAHILAADKKTVYAQSATVTVPAPETMTALRHQLVKKYRGALRSLLRHPAAARKNPIVTASITLALLSPVVYLSILAASAFIVAYGVYQFNTGITSGDLVLALVLALVVYVALSYVRHLPVLRSTRDALWLPVLVVYGGLLSLWAKTVALFTLAENARDSKQASPYGEGKVGRARTAVAVIALAMFAIALPVAYGALVKPQNVPFSVITAQQGKPFATARAYAERLNDDQQQNDPSNEELFGLVRSNGVYYGQDVNEAVAATSYNCVRDALKNAPALNALDNTQACYANAELVAAANKNAPEIIKEDPVVTISAVEGDTLTYLVRAQVKKLDGKNELSAAQVVFIETTYLQQTGQLDHYMAVGEVASINTDDLKVLVGSAKGLSAEQTAAWNYYATDIIW